MDKGEGVQKYENFADIKTGSSLAGLSRQWRTHDMDGMGKPITCGARRDLVIAGGILGI